MTKMSFPNGKRVMVTIGILAALLSAAGAAQEIRQVSRGKVRMTQDAPLPEMVLLPDSIPFPLRVVGQPAPPPPEAAPIPAPAQVADQGVIQPQMQPPDQFQPVPRARPRFLTPPSESTALPEFLAAPAASQLVGPGAQTPPQVAIFETADLFPPANPAISIRDHPAVGAYFGKAIQVCAAGVAPSACANGQQAGMLFMNPVLTGDGLIIADDSLTLLDPPYGPHACAHGTWVPTSATEFTAEYTFITRTFPPLANTISGLRARWVAKVLDADTLVGWVNAYFLTSSPVAWTPLSTDEFPAYPPEALGFVTPPNGFVKDPSTCMTAGCPQVFKFTLKRIRR